MALTPEELQTCLAVSLQLNHPPESPYPAGVLDHRPRKAAVLIPFCWQQNQWQIIYIRRAKNQQDRHSGQVAFPGGSAEAHEANPETTALREAAEEIGIRPKDVKLFGRLRDMLTISNFRVTPIVGLIPWQSDWILQPNEVARIFSIPLKWLANPQNRSVQTRHIASLGVDVPVIYFERYDGELLWGASARITVLLLEALGMADPSQRYG